jgi:uncharacterized membrane protein YdjX (TVP38/TMEM64 family)/fatty acid desaturase
MSAVGRRGNPAGQALNYAWRQHGTTVAMHVVMPHRMEHSATLPELSSIELLREARRVVRDLREPSPRIYWTDLLLTASVTWAAIGYGACCASGITALALSVLVAGLALTRASMFMHELTHMRRGAVPGLRLAYDALIGVPFGVPLSFYERVHLDHHKVAVYRTAGDPEHAPDARSLVHRTAETLLAPFLLPPLLVVRWMVLPPVALLAPRLRRWLDTRASGLTSNPAYRPAAPRGRALREARISEACCSAFAILVLLLVVLGVLPIAGVALAMAAISIASLLSNFRGSFLHSFRSGEPIGTLARQVFDSVNVPHTGLVSALVLPVGIGYHALHHLDARLPYHAMPEAHARLLATLPKGSAYHRVTSSGIVSAASSALGISSSPLWRLPVLGLLLVALALIGRTLRLDEALVSGLAALGEEGGVLGAAGYVGAATIGDVLQLPGVLFWVAAVTAYGPWHGAAVAYLGMMGAALSGFVLARSVAGGALSGVTHPRVRAWIARIDRSPILSVAFIRGFLFVLPATSVACALSSVRLRDYFVGSALGLLVPTAITAAIAVAVL